MKNKSKLSCTVFLTKYVSLALYDENMEKIFIIDQEQLDFDKNIGWNLIGILVKPDGNFSDHEYFCIHYDIFDMIQSTHKDRNIMWKFLSNEPNENNLRVKQQRNTMTRSKIRRVLLPKHSSIILSR